MNQPDSDRDRAGEQVSGTGAAVAAAPLSRTRRRLIRAGASAVPVIATLSSRPVMGATGQCLPVSAVGSVLLMDGASQRARLNNSKTVSFGTVGEWSTDPSTVSSSPWAALNTGTWSGYGTAKEMYDGLKVSELFGTSPSTLSNFALVNAALKTGSEFQKRIVTARLNMWIPGNGMADCLSIDALTTMASGEFTPAPGIVWYQADISLYLLSNNLAPG